MLTLSKMKVILIAFVIFLIAIGGFIYKKSTVSPKTPTTPSPTVIQTQSDSPKIVSTKPDPLEEAIVPTNQVVEITFNLPLQNSGEFKLRIEPNIEFKVQLSQDRKTAKIIPQKSLDLGTTYTIVIGTDTKFDGVGAWGQEKIYHFKTIKYTGV